MIAPTISLVRKVQAAEGRVVVARQHAQALVQSHRDYVDPSTLKVDGNE